MNSDKRTPLAKAITCLGINIDLESNILSTDQEKLAAIHIECGQIKDKKCLTKRGFQSLLDKLLYLHKCVRPSRIFFYRMLKLFRDNHGAKRIPLTEEFHRDLQWFFIFLPKFNGVTYIDKPEIPENRTLYIDACLTGLGGVWGQQVYVSPIIGKTLKIVHLEMLNVVVALRLWATDWAHSAVKLFCDNLAVVQVVQTSKTKDSFLAACIRNVWLLMATYDIDLQVQLIAGSKNDIDDLLSRIYSDKPINNSLFQHLQNNYQWRRIPEQYLNLLLHI